MDLVVLHQRAVEAWTDRLSRVADHQWDLPTPCSGWQVRDLVNHVVGEERWTVPLLAGSTIEDVGDSLDGDLLGSSPVAAGLEAAHAAVSAVDAAPADGTVHLSYGEESVEEYVRQLVADHVIHAWDLAAAIDADRRLDAELVAEVARWFAEREEIYRSVGAIGPRASTGRGADAQAELLAASGRDPGWGPTHALLASFSAAFGSGEVEAIMGLMTDDCVFEATGPAPDGVRHEGAAAVREVWVELFGGTTDPVFTEEESFVAGDRGVLRWRFDWTGDDGAPGHVRGTDVMRFRDGLVCEKLSYVKG